jgi:hypothetical protein
VLRAGAGPAAAVAFVLPLRVGAAHLLLPLLASLLSQQFARACRAHAAGADEEYAALKARERMRSVRRMRLRSDMLHFRFRSTSFGLRGRACSCACASRWG